MESSTRVFRSRVDNWYYVVLVFIGALALHAMLRPESNVTPVGGLVLAIFVFALPVWILVATRYTVSGDVLRVRAGPFFWNIRISDIHSLTPSRSPLSSPALSLDRIEIQYGAGKRLYVSPDDRKGFADALGLEFDEGE